MRRIPCLSLATLLVLLELTLSVARAQGTPDVSPPLIEHEPLGRVTAAARQAFTAQVADDRNLQSVTLHYRRQGDRIFISVPMTEMVAAAFYRVSLDTDPGDLRTIEYYLQAFDEGGNRTISGFAFDPLRRELKAAPQALQRPVITSEAAEPSRRGVRWWHVALGALAVGTLAALATGGSDSGDSGIARTDDPDSDSDTVPFTITLGEPR